MLLKELAKQIKNEMKKEFPNVKFSIKTTISRVDVKLIINESNLINFEDFSKKFSELPVSIKFGASWQLDENMDAFNRNNEAYKLAKYNELIERAKQPYTSANECLLNEETTKAFKTIQNKFNAYNYDDSDVYRDYFDRGFYDFYTIELK